MAKIKCGLRSIEIRNFRGIESLDLNFEDAQGGVSDIVVVAGPNGSGKTTVLEACLHFTDAIGQAHGAIGAGAARVGTSEYHLKGSIQRFGNTSPADYSVSDKSVVTVRSPSGETEKVFVSATDNIRALYVSSFRSQILAGALPITAGNATPYQHSSDAEGNRLALVKQYLINAKAFEAMGGNGVNSSLTVGNLTRRLDEAWRVFFPSNQTRFEIQPVGPRPNYGFDLYLLSSTGRISVDALSSGQLELITLFGTLLLTRQIDVLIIDEPELHLDPQWHVPMLRAFRTMLPETQIIVGTHSPQIYDSVLSFQRHLLLPEGDPRTKVFLANGHTTPQP
jgi:energy-coupling factor transporter ATP-binding protein EcfA2